jgi:acetolactate synthase-1/2/3 large subunit
VHIEIPLDVLVENADHLLDSQPVSITPAGPSPAAIKQMAGLLAKAKRPLILAGGGAIDAASALTQLAEKLDAPVALTINAKGMLPSSHPLLIGSTQSLDPTREIIEGADVVLAIGTELAETDYDITFQGHFKIPGTLLRIDIDPDQTVRNFPPKVALVSDARTAAEALVAALNEETLAERQSDWGHKRAAALKETLTASWDEATRGQTLFLQTVLEVLPDVVLVGDSTQPVYTGNLTLDLDKPRRWFNSSTGYGTLGYALPAAVGAWLGSQEAGEHNPVACLIGDGGLQFTLSELASAVEARTPIIVLLWNNQGYEEIKKYMVNRAIEPVGVDIYTPDFIGVAKALGCAAEAVSSVGQLKTALNAANDRQGPTVIEIDQRRWMNGLKAL